MNQQGALFRGRRACKGTSKQKRVECGPTLGSSPHPKTLNLQSSAQMESSDNSSPSGRSRTHRGARRCQGSLDAKFRVNRGYRGLGFQGFRAYRIKGFRGLGLIG